jgi:DNA-binding ferritin-like protein
MATPTKFVELLMHSRNQAHAFHLVTDKRSIHKALEKYYEGIVPLLDSWAEAYMGKYGRLRSVNVNKKFMRDPRKAKEYFRSLLVRVRAMSRLSKDSYLRNIYDEIIALIRSTLYMLSLR